MASEGPRFGLCASVPAPRAQRALELLGDEGLRDARYRVRQAGDRVLVPVRDGEAALDRLGEGRLARVRLEPAPRRPPIERVRERLAGELSPAQLEALPEGWTRLGDVLLLRVPPSLLARAERLAAAYGRALGVDSVLHLEGSRGPLREPETRLLWGEEDTETVHREHGIAYRLDPAEVTFSPGNKTERHRLRDRVAGEHVVDLFAGVGYFALPLADAGARVTACEVNPTAADYLEANREANGLADRVEVRRGDCRDLAPSDLADRVLMGYLPGTAAYLGTALEALAPEGGWIHYHDAAARPDPVDRALGRVRGREALAGCEVRVGGARTVKTLDPQRCHVALDLEVRP